MSKEKPITVYLAGPLFTQAEWQWNERLADKLREASFNVILPQSTAEPMLMGVKPFDPGLLFRENMDGIERADAVVAIFDGADADSGTSWECGFAFKARKPVIGVRTDIRAGGDDPAMSTNLMLSAACAEFVHVPLAERGKVARVAGDVVAAVKKALRKDTL